MGHLAFLLAHTTIAINEANSAAAKARHTRAENTMIYTG